MLLGVVRYHTRRWRDPGAISQAQVRPGAARGSQDPSREVDSPIHTFQRPFAHGDQRRQDRKPGPGELLAFSTEATLETQLYNRHRPGDREAANRLLWRPERGASDQNKEGRPDKPHMDLSPGQEDRAAYNHTPGSEDLAPGPQTHFRARVAALRWDDRQPTKTARTQTPMEHGPLSPLYHGGRQTEPRETTEEV